MKHLRKSILTLLALTLFGGAGAWAQGPTQVTQFTTDLIASWQTDNSALTLADMQALGFVAVDESVAAAWTGAPSGEARLFFAFNNSEFRYVFYDNGSPVYGGDFIATKADFYHDVTQYQYFYTGSPEPAAIELTKAGANQWTLGQTPDYDLELQVEYYEAHALKDIPAGWTVLVNGVDKTSAIDHDSLMITETDSVTLIPANPRRVKSVTLEDEVAVQTVTIGNVTLQVVEGETWRQIAQRNPGVITADDEDNGYVYRDMDTVLRTGTAYLRPTDTYNSSLDYYWYEY